MQAQDSRPNSGALEYYEAATPEFDNLNLAEFDLILLNTSGGKDSQAMMDLMMATAKHQGYAGQIHAVHADLDRMEWEGSWKLVQDQCSHYGIENLHKCKRDQDLLEQVKERGMWPSPSARYCTSDHKRDQIQKVVVKLAKALKLEGISHPRILNCLGFRSEESAARANKPILEINKRASTKTRTVTNYLPIHSWIWDQVWTRISESGAPYAAAYDLGMSRYSCRFCIMSSKADLVISAKANIPLLDELIQIEEDIDHTFQPKLSLAEVKAEAIQELALEEEEQMEEAEMGKEKLIDIPESAVEKNLRIGMKEARRIQENALALWYRQTLQSAFSRATYPRDPMQWPPPGRRLDKWGITWGSVLFHAHRLGLWLDLMSNGVKISDLECRWRQLTVRISEELKKEGPGLQGRYDGPTSYSQLDKTSPQISPVQSQTDFQHLALFLAYVGATADTWDFWNAQYQLRASGCTDGQMHDSTLVAWSRLEHEGVPAPLGCGACA